MKQSKNLYQVSEPSIYLTPRVLTAPFPFKLPTSLNMMEKRIAVQAGCSLRTDNNVGMEPN